MAIKRATRPIAKSRESSGFFKFERKHTLITSAGVTQSSTALARMSSVSVRDSGEIDIRGVFHAFTPVQTDVRKPVVRGTLTGTSGVSGMRVSFKLNLPERVSGAVVGEDPQA